MMAEDGSEEQLMSFISAFTVVYEELDGKLAAIKDAQRVLELSGSKDASAAKLKELCDMMNDSRREDGLLKEV